MMVIPSSSLSILFYHSVSPTNELQLTLAASHCLPCKIIITKPIKKLYLLVLSAVQTAHAVSRAISTAFSSTGAPVTSGAATALSTTLRLSVPGFLPGLQVPYEALRFTGTRALVMTGISHPGFPPSEK